MPTNKSGDLDLSKPIYQDHVANFRVPYGHWVAFEAYCSRTRTKHKAGLVKMIEAYVEQKDLDYAYDGLPWWTPAANRKKG